MPQLSPLALQEGTGSARKADGEVGSAGLETMAASPLLWEARGQIQGRVFAGDQLSSVGENRNPDGHLNISFG